MMYIQFSPEDLHYLLSLLDIANNNRYPDSVRQNYKCFVTGATYQRDYTVKINNGKMVMVNKLTGEIYTEKRGAINYENILR